MMIQRLQGPSIEQYASISALATFRKAQNEEARIDLKGNLYVPLVRKFMARCPQQIRPLVWAPSIDS